MIKIGEIEILSTNRSIHKQEIFWQMRKYHSPTKRFVQASQRVRKIPPLSSRVYNIQPDYFFSGVFSNVATRNS